MSISLHGMVHSGIGKYIFNIINRQKDLAGGLDQQNHKCAELYRRLQSATVPTAVQMGPRFYGAVLYAISCTVHTIPNVDRFDLCALVPHCRTPCPICVCDTVLYCVAKWFCIQIVIALESNATQYQCHCHRTSVALATHVVSLLSLSCLRVVIRIGIMVV